jgi:xanthine/uracil/vitamin C permease (AzgA family)
MEKTMKKSNAFTEFLDRKFHITERGTTVKQETWAGMGAFCIAVCALLMNTQTIGTYYGNYAGAYFAVSLVAFLGTMLVGIICNLPLLMTANMSLSTVMISIMSANTGITYANLLMVTFIAEVCYLVIVLTPLKKIFVDVLPAGVRKALPVGTGVYVIYTALKNSGLLAADGTVASAKDLTDLNLFYFWLLIAGIVLMAVYTGVKRRNAFGSTYFMLIAAMWVCGIVFYMEYFVGGQTATTLVYQRVNLIFATDGAAPYNILNGISALKVGELFSQGVDFSAYTEAGGNVALFIIESVLTFLFMGMYTTLGNADGALADGDDDTDLTGAEEKKLLTVGAAVNVVSSLLGGTPVSVGSQSAMETRDGGKTGWASVVAGIGFLIALFNWIFFALTATATNGVGMWINDTETKLAAYVQDGFIFADLIMVFVGAAMLKSLKKLNISDQLEFIPFVITLAGMAFTSNFVLGAAVGTVIYLILKLISPKRRETRVPEIILTVIFIAFAFIALKYGGNYVTPVSQMGFGGPPM